MKEEIPNIHFNNDYKLNVEIMNFGQLFNKLNLITNHDPFKAHKIEFYFILVVTNNFYTHFVDFKTYKLKKGSAIFIAKNQVHRFNKKLLDAEGICIVFNSLFFENNYFLPSKLRLNSLFNYHIETPVIHQKEMGEDSFNNTVEKLYNEYVFPNDFAKSEIIKSLLNVLFLKAERAKELSYSSDTKLHWLEIFDKFKILLEKEYINTRNSKIYASQLMISYKFLNKIVKKLTNKTVKTFIDDFVTTEIKRYLVSSSLSVKEISYKTGFDEPGNMSKFFKKNTNTTPNKFRK